jgi:Undecaprenyl-phosphate glucose phosphotransferase
MRQDKLARHDDRSGEIMTELQMSATVPAGGRSASHRERLAAGRGRVAWVAAFASIEMLVVGVGTYAAFVAYDTIAYGGATGGAGYGWASTLLAGLYAILCLADDQYDVLVAEDGRRELMHGARVLAVAFALLLAAGFVTGTLDTYSRGTFLTQMAVAIPAQIVTRFVLIEFVDRARREGQWIRCGLTMVVLPGAGEPAKVLDRLSVRREDILQLHTLQPGEGQEAGLERKLAQIRHDCRLSRSEVVLIVFDDDSMDLVTQAVSAFSELPVRIRLLPVGLADFMRCSRVAQYGREHLLEIVSGPSTAMDQFLKRGLDIAVALVATVALSPLMAAVALLIKLDSRGPVIFRQIRHGFNNVPIRVLKFRTMTATEDGRSEFRQAVRADPRVTRVGRMLRRTNIDELPQLLNVLRGEMSLVGPRPHAVAHNDMYADQIRRLSRRHTVKPGITGWAQVNGFRGETDTVEKMRKRVELDLYYIDNWSILLDVKILVMTLFSRKSYANAY